MFSFGSKAAGASTASSSTAAPAATAPASGGFSFGASSTSAGPSPAAPSAFSSFKLPTPATSSSTATTTPAPAAGTSTAPAPALSFTAPATNNTAGSKPLFGAPAPPASTASTAAAAAPSTTNTSAVATAAGITPVQPAPVTAPAPSLLRGKSLADILHRLESDLSASINSFTSQASEIAAWDEQLLHVGDELKEVLHALERAEEGQSQVEGALSYVEGQQDELEGTLSQFEAIVGGWEREVGLGSGGSAALASAVAGGAGANSRASLGAGGSAFGQYRGAGLDSSAADLERENAYALAESLNSQLDDMSSALKTMIEDVNTLSNPAAAASSASKANGSSALAKSASSASNAEDAVQQIVSILNSHLGSLRWVDDNVRDLSEQVQALKLNAGAGSVHNSDRTALSSSRNGTLRGASVGPRASLGPSAGPTASPGYGHGGFYREGSVASSRRRF